MATYEIGDLVVLKSGSMRMTVETVEDAAVQVVWCHEGVIGRDRFDVALLNKWEVREDHGGHRGGDRGGFRGGDRGDRGGWNNDRGDRGAWNNDRGGDRGGYRGGDRGGDRGDRGGWHDRGGDRDGGGEGRGGWNDKPRKTGWDGKPRDKKYFRKDD
ncbi:MAG: hypothetical protein AAFS07_07520 [Pseudomonadota bacterium]